MNKFWPFTFNFILYAGIATVAPFIVLYYQGLGFTGAQIGLLTGITPLINILSATLWTGFADATSRHRLLMTLAILGGSIGLFIFPLLTAFVPVFLIFILFSIFWAPVTPLADSATMFMLADKKEMYSRIRLGATLGFGLAAPIAGALVQNYGLRLAFWGCATLFLLGLIVSQKLSYGQLQADGPTRERVRTLMSNPRWVLFLVVAFAGGLGIAAYNNYLYPYMKELGANESTMGLALLVGMFSEIPVLFFGNRLIKRLKPWGLLVLSMVVTGLRMILFATSGTPNLILLFQLLNGLTFPTMWVAGVSYADENAPPGMSASVQGLFSAMVLGFGTAVGGLTGGLLLGSVGGRGLYFVLGIAVLVIVVIAALVQKRLLAKQALSTSM